ncbi:MAG: hypothetical protein WKG07_38870 [Hymenobacter sp.]
MEPDSEVGGVLFYHLLHTAWLLAYGYIYQDYDGLYWVELRQPYDYCLNYELVEVIGLGQIRRFNPVHPRGCLRAITCR